MAHKVWPTIAGSASGVARLARAYTSFSVLVFIS